MNRPRNPAISPLRWGVAVAWALLVAVVLWSAGTDEPPPWPWLVAFESAGGDKLVHAGLFGVQAWLLCRCRQPLGRRWLAACFGAVVVYGLVTEVGQLAVPGRDASVGDALADAAGAAVGVALAAWGSRRR